MTKTRKKLGNSPWLKTLFPFLEYLLHWQRVFVFSTLALSLSFLAVFFYTYVQLPAPPPGEFVFTFQLVLQDSFSQLIGQSVFNSPVTYGSPLAMFILPCFTGLLLTLCLACFCRTPLLLGLLRFCQCFSVVFGDGPIPSIILKTCRKRDGVVVHIKQTDGSASKFSQGFLSITESAFIKLPASLLNKCQEIIAIAPNDIDNVRFTNHLYGNISGVKQCPKLVACIRSTQLKNQLTQRYEDAANSFNIPLTLVGLNEFLARMLLNTKAPDRFRFADKPLHQHALIFGLGNMGEALLKEFLRQHAYSHMKKAQPHTLSLADASPQNLQEISHTYKQALEGFVEIRTLESSALSYRINDEALLAACVDSPLTAIYLCLGSAEADLSAAMHLEEQLFALGLAVPPIILTSTESIEPSTLLTHSSPYVSAGYLDLSMTGESLVANFIDTLKKLDVGARILHEDYLQQRLDDGEKIGDRPALQHWEQLSEFFKDDNRTLTDHLAYKLRDQGFYLSDDVPSSDAHSDNIFSDSEIEKLAYAEHLRWWFNRLVKGWKYAPVRNDAKKEHPDMIAWEALDEPAREKDRDMIRQLAPLAHSMGKRIKKRHYFLLELIENNSLNTAENLAASQESLNTLATDIKRHANQGEAIIVSKADTQFEVNLLNTLKQEKGFAYILISPLKPAIWKHDSLVSRQNRATLMADALQIVTPGSEQTTNSNNAYLDIIESLDFAEKKYTSNLVVNAVIENDNSSSVSLKVSIDHD